MVAGVNNKKAWLWRFPSFLPRSHRFVHAWAATRSRRIVDGSGALREITQQELVDCYRQLESTEQDWVSNQQKLRELDALVCHRADADECEAEQNWFGAEFHLNFLLANDPDNSTLRSRLEHAKTKQVARKKAPNDAAGIIP